MSESLDERRRELLEENNRVREGSFKFPLASKLDTSIKKNTTFLHRIRLSINNEQASYCIRDVKSLSLDKYLDDIITYLKEGLQKIIKNEEIFATVEIINALHQRYTSSFTPYILSHLINMIAFPSIEAEEKDTQTSLARQRTALKIIMELHLVGIVRTFEDTDKESLDPRIGKHYDGLLLNPILYPLIRSVVRSDKNGENSSQTFVSLIKRFKHLLFNENSIIDEDIRVELKKFFFQYTNDSLERLSKIHKNVQQAELKLQKSSIRTGKILEEYTAEYEHYNALFEKFKVSCEYLTNVLELEMPKFSDEETIDRSTVHNKEETKSKPEIWRSDEEKEFYTKIPDYSKLQIKGSKAGSKSAGERVSTLLVQLDSSVTAKDLNRLSKILIESNLYNKATKNRILKFFIEAPDTDNVKGYARFLRTCYFLLKDVVDELVGYLDNGFRHHLYSSQLNFKFIIFYVELIKFRLVPTHLIFHKINHLTKNITSTNNIDILSIIYERIGLFLLTDPEYGELMADMVDLLKAKTKKEVLSVNEKFAIENLLSLVDSSMKTTSSKDKHEKSLSLQQRFLMRLITADLSSDTLKQVIKISLQSDFQNKSEIRSTLIGILTSPHKINFENIGKLSLILSKLGGKYSFLIPVVVDSVIENITCGLELNDYRMNRQRLAHIRYIAELYNSKLLHFKHVADICYKIICFGYPSNQPLPSSNLTIDSQDNYFRIFLCCDLLASIAFHERSKGKSNSDKLRDRTLLVSLLVFFQYYIFCKLQPLPVEVDFKVITLIEKYSNFEEVKRFESLEEVIVALKRLTLERQHNESNKLSDDASKIAPSERSQIRTKEEHGSEEASDSNAIDHQGTEFSYGSDEDSTDDGYSDVEEERNDDSSDVELDADDYGFDVDSDGDDNEDIEDDEDDEDDIGVESIDSYDDDEDDDVDDDDDDDDDVDGDDEEEEEEVDDDDGSLSESESEKSSIIYSSVTKKSSADHRIIPEDKHLADELDTAIRELALESFNPNKFSNSERLKPNISAFKPTFQHKNANNPGLSLRLLTKNGRKTNIKDVYLPANDKFASAISKQNSSKQQNIEKTMNLVMNMDD